MPFKPIVLCRWRGAHMNVAILIIIFIILERCVLGLRSQTMIAVKETATAGSNPSIWVHLNEMGFQSRGVRSIGSKQY